MMVRHLTLALGMERDIWRPYLFYSLFITVINKIIYVRPYLSISND